jgi:hypothetical protein
MTPFKRIIILLSVAAVISIAIIGCVVEAQRWNNPPNVSRSTEGDLIYHGIPLHMKMTCECPEYLFLSEPQDVAFTISISSITRTIQSPTQATSASVQPATTAITQSVGASSSIPAENLWVWPSIDSIFTTLKNGDYGQFLVNSANLNKNEPITTNITVVLLGKVSPTNIAFHLATNDTTNHYEPDISSVSLAFEARSRFSKAFLPVLSYASVFIFLSSLALVLDWRIRTANKRREEKVARAKELADKNPEHTRYAWQLARTRLENYFDKNLFQVNMVFWLAVLVMTAGFLVVLWGVKNTIDGGHGGEIAAGAGVITQFLGATFMVIYRSTMQQANDFMTVLDRINNVGMAMQVLDQISDEPAALKNEVRAKIVDRLLTLGRTQDHETPSQKASGSDPKKGAA